MAESPKTVARPEDRIKILVDKANEVSADDAIPINRYWRSARELLRMANVYLDEKDFEKCFILYMKYIILFIERLPKHHEYKIADSAEKARVKNICTKLIPIAEEVKAKIKARYQSEFETYLQEKKIYDEKVAEKQVQQQKQLEIKKQEQTDKFVSKFQLELDRKKRELEESKNKITPTALPHEYSRDRDEEIIIEDYQSDDDNSLEEHDSEVATSPQASAPLLNEHTIKPQIDRSTKPSVNEGGRDQLCELIVPFKSITDKFTNLAMSNTIRNVETCAILCGKLSHNRFTITHVMVPKQTGTSETCAAMNEEELMEAQERLDLITVGWIHTHPSQRSFLSSVDLHTHAPYQKMLPEAIAIVVAPTDNEIGLYSLTEHGLDYILRCRQSGFHPHPNEQSLYGDAKHVHIENSLSVEVVDFR